MVLLHADALRLRGKVLHGAGVVCRIRATNVAIVHKSSGCYSDPEYCIRQALKAHAARHHQEAGLIRYVRGHITILDRPGLEATVCECYRVVKDEFTRLLG